MGLKQRSEKLFRGWLPKEPILEAHSVTIEVKTEQDEKMSRQLTKAMAITNPIVGGVFFALNPASWSSPAIVVTFAELALVLLVTNVVIALYLRHRIYGGT